MSKQNVEIVLRLYAEVNARLYGASPDLFVDEYEVDARDVAVDFGVVKGFDAVTQALQTYWETFDGFHLELEEVIHADEQLVVTAVRDGGRIKDSDEEVWERFFHVWTFRDGKVVRLSLHADRHSALDAAGPRE
jgi:ketosteroid isomerase-like protein